MSLEFSNYSDAHKETKSYEYFTKINQNVSGDDQNYGNETSNPNETQNQNVAQNLNETQNQSVPVAPVAPVVYKPPIKSERKGATTEKKGNFTPEKTLAFFNILQRNQLELFNKMDKKQAVALTYFQKKQNLETERLFDMFQNSLKEIVTMNNELNSERINTNGNIVTRSDIKEEISDQIQYSKYFGEDMYKIPENPDYSEMEKEINEDPEYESLFEDPVIPRGPGMDHLKFSDENPLTRPFGNVKNLLYGDRLWISDLQKNVSTDPAEDFAVDLNSGYSNIVEIYPLVVDIRWTPTATYTRNVLLYFPDFDHHQTTSNGFRYHNYIPLEQGTAGTPLTFSFRLDDDYSTDFRKMNKINNHLRVQLFKENSTTGAFVPFEELNAVAIELRIKTIAQNINNVPFKDFDIEETEASSDDRIVNIPKSDSIVPLLID